MKSRFHINHMVVFERIEKEVVMKGNKQNKWNPLATNDNSCPMIRQELTQKNVHKEEDTDLIV